MAAYQIHEDYLKLQITVPLYAPILPSLQRMTRFMFKRQSIPNTIDHCTYGIGCQDGHSISIEIFSPCGLAHNAPCLLFLHGGAFVLPATGYHKRLMCDYALGCASKVVFVDYRLAPRYPYPHGLADCFSVYNWLLEHAQTLDIDINRIGVCGDSSGGALAAALTLMIRDRSIKKPLFQLLVYPVLDMRMTTGSMKIFQDTPIWNAKLNQKMWKLYVPGNQVLDRPEYASPALSASFDNVPKCYIEVNEFDCLRDEAIDYSQKLSQSKIDIVLVQTKGTVHGFELNYRSAYTQQIIKTRIDYMNRQFYADP